MALPQLRFKGFTAEWSKKRLDSFLERVSKPVDVVDDQEYVQIGIRSHGKGIFHKKPLTGKELGNKRVFWIVPNALVVNIVFAWERAIAVTSQNENGLIASHRFPMYLPKNNLSNVDFLRYMFITDKGQSYLELASPGGAGRNKTLGQTNFAELKIDLPEIEEQTQIASFLSAVDEKISELTKKHELLSQYKQGMMQKLFSQQIRFKADDGSEFREWDKKQLSRILTESLIKGSKGDKAKKLTVKLWGKGVVAKNEVFQGSENTQYYKRSKGQLIYGKLDFLNGAFGIIPDYLDGYESTIDAPAFDVNQEQCNSLFLFYRLLQKDFYKKNGDEADGSRKAKRINQKVFLAMSIDLPSLSEQTKIANFLSTIDQKIDKVSQQIEETKQWKKGLLQQMFV
ncbi:restriction endonuclease subunit S [Acinetobacter baumannii]|nr:restriction endonuclease subunit S [Acinetobacter baumannii]MDA4923160.1 restriction endonuclease subunit S [Acinetobacter baumannii]TPU92011.1 restriction endonuclease subunit S [Acinetobacter baumannii]